MRRPTPDYRLAELWHKAFEPWCPLQNYGETMVNALETMVSHLDIVVKIIPLLQATCWVYPLKQIPGLVSVAAALSFDQALQQPFVLLIHVLPVRFQPGHAARRLRNRDRASRGGRGWGWGGHVMLPWRT